MTEVHASYPAKVILSGEHAVLLGAPATGVAIERFSTCTIAYAPSKVCAHTIDIPATKDHLTLSHDALMQSQPQAKAVIQSPLQFVMWAMHSWYKTHNMTPAGHHHITLDSSIPLKSGLGSSAATALALFDALAKMHGIRLGKSRLIETAIAAENLLHGKSSGLDVRLSALGGYNHIDGQTATQLPLMTTPIQLIDTGQPDSSTFDCVQHTLKALQHNKEQLQQFREITEGLKQHMLKRVKALPIDWIQRNHRLLCDLAVVPEPVKTFIQRIEAAGMAAKITGAGSLRGKHAGMLWAVGEARHLAKLAAEYGYKHWQVQVYDATT